MIRAWRLANFKSVKDRTELVFAPLTVLAGANSSGKSSLIQSLLAAAQTVAALNSEDPLVLNGSLIRLGHLRDLRTQGAGHRAIAMGVTLDVTEHRPRGQPRTGPVRGLAVLDFTTSPDPSTGVPRLDRVALSTRPGTASRLVGKRGRTGGRLQTTLASASVVRRRLPVWRLAVDLHQPDLAEVAPSLTRQGRGQFRPRPGSSIGGIQLQGFTPVGLAVDEDEGVIGTEEVIAALRDPARVFPIGFRRLSGDLSRTILEFIQSHGRKRVRAPRTVASSLSSVRPLGREARQELANLIESQLIDAPSRFMTSIVRTYIYPLPGELDAAAEAVIDTLSEGLRYLGPLRADPSASYDLPPSGQKADVGLKGEFTAAVLHQYRDQMVAHVSPALKRSVRQPLRRAVDDWLRHLGLLESARPSAPSRFGHQLLLAPEGLSSPVDPTYVGVGVSQVLPVIVQGLLTPVGGVLVLEQPELHLHPDVQADIADFLIALVGSQRQVLVETHSEHLVNRIRLRIAERELLPEVVSIYFVTRAPVVGSRFERVGLTKAGSLTSWPAGFLDRATLDAQKLVQANLRLVEKE